jgi:NAD-dependent SIR2 family protein deacetylase
MDLHEAKTRLQQHLTDGIVAIVGSGMSCAEGLPSMRELGDHLRNTLGPTLAGDDVAAWSAIASLIQVKGLEANGTKLSA